MIRASHVRAYVALLPLCGPLWLGCGDDSGDPVLGETDTEATDTGDPAGLMTVTPMTLSLAVGASADVVVSGDTTPFPLEPDDAEFLVAWTTRGSVSVVHAGGIAQGDLVPARNAQYSETFTVTCDVEAPGTATFDLQGLGSVLAIATVTVTCSDAAGSTTGTTSTTGSTSLDPETSSGTGDPPSALSSVYCFDQFGAGLARINLGDDPSLEMEAFVGHVSGGVAFGNDPITFVGGLFPEDGEPLLVRYRDWALDDEPDAEIAHDSPNLFTAACPSSQGVLFVGNTTDSMVCDFDAGSCTEVMTPIPLNTCQCAGPDCIAGAFGRTGLLVSDDGGLTFTAQGNEYRPNRIFGDGQGVMAFDDTFFLVSRVSQDSGASFFEPTVPAGFDGWTPYIVIEDRIVGGVPFMPGELVVSSNEGVDWFSEPFSDENYPEQIIRTTQGDLAAVTEAGTIFHQPAPFDGAWQEVPGLSVPFLGRCFGR